MIFSGYKSFALQGQCKPSTESLLFVEVKPVLAVEKLSTAKVQLYSEIAKKNRFLSKLLLELCLKTGANC